MGGQLESAELLRRWHETNNFALMKFGDHDGIDDSLGKNHVSLQNGNWQYLAIFVMDEPVFQD